LGALLPWQFQSVAVYSTYLDYDWLPCLHCFISPYLQWHKRVKLFDGNPTKQILTYTEAVKVGVRERGHT
jgi:hypothetical protein